MAAKFKNLMGDKEADLLLQEILEYAESDEVAEKYKNLKTPFFIDLGENLDPPPELG